MDFSLHCTRSEKYLMCRLSCEALGEMPDRTPIQCLIIPSTRIWLPATPAMHSRCTAHQKRQIPEGAAAAIAAQPTPQVQLASVMPEPDPVSPMGFSCLAGLIGLAGGMVLAPWLERWYRRTVKHDREDKDD